MKNSFSVRVPASTSNLGAGFDTLSAALTLHLRVQVAPLEGDRIEWVDPQGSPLPFPEKENLADRALRDTLALLGTPIPGLRIVMDSPIPPARGLGSSAAAILAGVKIAEELGGLRLDAGQVFRIAYPLEGHPDNLAASLLGGWVLSWVEDGVMRAERLSSAVSCRFAVAVPEVRVSTKEAREILPARFSLEDATFNLQRCALLVHALGSGRKDLLRQATQDRLHQSFRGRLVPGMAELLNREGLPEPLSGNLLGITISGSGSTCLALADNHCGEIGQWMVDVFASRGTAASWQVLDLDTEGARIIRD